MTKKQRYMKKYMKQYAKTHRAEIAARMKKYNDAHRVEQALYAKKYCKEHRVEKALYDKKYNAEHRAERSLLHKTYCKEHRVEKAQTDKRYRQTRAALDANRKAKRFGAHGKWTAKQFLSLCKKYNNVCLCCHRRRRLTPDHIIPFCKGGSNLISRNIQPLCLPCNRYKHNSTTDYRPRKLRGASRQTRITHVRQ